MRFASLSFRCSFLYDNLCHGYACVNTSIWKSKIIVYKSSIDHKEKSKKQDARPKNVLTAHSKLHPSWLPWSLVTFGLAEAKLLRLSIRVFVSSIEKEFRTRANIKFALEPKLLNWWKKFMATIVYLVARVHEIALLPINHSPYLPDMAACNFYLFGKLHLAIKGKRFAAIEAIKRLVPTSWRNSGRWLERLLEKLQTAQNSVRRPEGTILNK